MKNNVYPESEASSPLYRLVLAITDSGLCDVWLRTEQDTCRVILARRRAPVWYGAHEVTCSLKCRVLRRCKSGHMLVCGWSSDRSITTCNIVVDLIVYVGCWLLNNPEWRMLIKSVSEILVKHLNQVFT